MFNDLPRRDLSGFTTRTPACHSYMAILWSGHVQLYPLDIFPTHLRRALGFLACGNMCGELF